MLRVIKDKQSFRRALYFLGGFIAIYFVMTFPYLLRLTSSIPGFFSTDESYGTLWASWFFRHSFFHHLALTSTDFISYPFGVTVIGGGFVGYLYLAIVLGLSYLFTPVIAFNFQIVLNFLLIFIFMTLIARRVLRDESAAFFTALIFTFSPYLFVRSWQHIGETYLWPLLCIVYACMRLDSSRLKFKVFFVVSFFLITINFNAAFYSVIVVALFCCWLLFNRRFRQLGRVLLLSMIGAIAMLPQFLPLITNFFNHASTVASAQNILHRPFEDLFAQSARPLSYFLPAVAHPVFGGFTEQFIGSGLYGSSFTEHTLFLGWLPIILGVIGIKAYMRKRVLSAGCTESEGACAQDERRFYMGFFGLLALVAWFFSQPPWWDFGSFKVYMPSFFMYKVFPMFRAYCRFGIVVMFAVSVLAGYGLIVYRQRFRSARARGVVWALACGIILFEFWNWPPFKVIDVSRVPQVYTWLKNEPADVVIAEYPLDTGGPDELHKFYQSVHGKKMINGTLPGTDANKVSNLLRNVSEPQIVAKLKWMGVKYVLVHTADYISSELIDTRKELDAIGRNSGLRMIKQFPAQDCPEPGIMCIQKTGPIDVYEVVTKDSVDPRL